MFKDNLISLRKANGLSQDELAEKIGVTRWKAPLTARHFAAYPLIFTAYRSHHGASGLSML